MLRIKKAYYLTLIIAGFVSCNEALAPESASLGYEYFPINTGDVRIYDVLRIDHNVDFSIDTTRYQLKEVVGDTFVSGGEESYRIERFTRLNETEEWLLNSVWSTRINAYQAIVVENNVPIIKLSFPLEEDRRWDGNAMNTKTYDEFKMVNLGRPANIDDLVFSETVEMIKEEALDPTQTVTDNFHKEFFARDIGMIYRVDIDKTYCTGSPCAETKIAFGLEIEYKLIEYQLFD